MKDQRFEAAKTAMHGMLSCHRTGDWLRDYAKDAVQLADALLAELAKPCRGPDQKAPQGSEPDALLMARLKAAEAVCERLDNPAWTQWVPARELVSWRTAKSAHEALPGAGGAT